MHPIKIVSSLALACIVGASCTTDPVYVDAPDNLTAGGPNADPDVPATTTLTLPIRLEETKEAEDRAALAAELGVEVPFIAVDDMAMSLEWNIRNLGDADANVRILLNGANEYFAYVPASFVVDPEEEPEPPPLLGDIPLQVPAAGSLQGVFREDQMREASIDLDLITRGGQNPFRAMLEIDEDITEIEVLDGTPIPLKAVAHLIRLDLTLLSDQEVVLEYAVRLRSKRTPNLVHEEGLSAAAGELTVFAPVDYVPPPPEDPAP